MVKLTQTPWGNGAYPPDPMRETTTARVSVVRYVGIRDAPCSERSAS